MDPNPDLNPRQQICWRCVEFANSNPGHIKPFPPRATPSSFAEIKQVPVSTSTGGIKSNRWNAAGFVQHLLHAEHEPTLDSASAGALLHSFAHERARYVT